MTLPASPSFGEPCPIRSSADTLALLAARRSSSAQMLAAPGPSAEQVDDLIRLAARVPDHGKLTPWRFVIMQGQPKAELVERLRVLAANQPNSDKALAALGKLAIPPTSIMVVSSPKPGSIPQWEQQMSAGAVCMIMLIAAEAMGFGANWITDWYAYDVQARAALGLEPGEQVAGFIHLGSAPELPLERVRPELAKLVSRLAG